MSRSHNHHEAARAALCCHPAGRRAVVQPSRPDHHASQPGLVRPVPLNIDHLFSGFQGVDAGPGPGALLCIIFMWLPSSPVVCGEGEGVGGSP